MLPMRIPATRCPDKTATPKNPDIIIKNLVVLKNEKRNLSVKLNLWQAWISQPTCRGWHYLLKFSETFLFFFLIHIRSMMACLLVRRLISSEWKTIPVGRNHKDTTLTCWRLRCNQGMRISTFNKKWAVSRKLQIDPTGFQAQSSSGKGKQQVRAFWKRQIILPGKNSGTFGQTDVRAVRFIEKRKPKETRRNGIQT